MRVHKIASGPTKWPQIAYIKNEKNNFRKSSKELLQQVQQNFASTLTSLSHTEKMSFVAFSNDPTCLRVGIDAEEKNRSVLPSVKSKILKELDCPESAELETLYIWTAKEAAFKTFSFLGATIMGETFLEKIEGHKFEISYVDSKQKKYSAHGIWIELSDHLVAVCALQKTNLSK